MRLKFLREGIIDPEQDGVEPHPVIGEVLEATNSAVAVLAGVGSVRLKVKVRRKGASAVQPFEYREFGTEKNFVHRSGLRITMDRSTVQMPDGLQHHPMESEVFQPTHPTSLAGSVINFFRLFRPGAVIELQPGWEIPIDSFGDNLTAIGDAVDGLPGLCTALKQSLHRICIGDLRDEEFARSTWFLEALLIKEILIGAMASGFIVGPAANLPLDLIPTIPVSARVPIALNWKNSGIVIWVDCDAKAYLQDDTICGVRLENHTGWRIQKTGRLRQVHLSGNVVRQGIGQQCRFARVFRELRTGRMTGASNTLLRPRYDACVTKTNALGDEGTGWTYPPILFCLTGTRPMNRQSGSFGSNVRIADHTSAILSTSAQSALFHRGGGFSRTQS